MNTTALLPFKGNYSNASFSKNQTSSMSLKPGFCGNSGAEPYGQDTYKGPKSMAQPKFSGLYTPVKTVLGFLALIEVIRHFSGAPVVQATVPNTATSPSGPLNGLMVQHPGSEAINPLSAQSAKTIPPFSVVVEKKQVLNLNALIQFIGPKSAILEGRRVSQTECTASYPIPTWASSGITKPKYDSKTKTYTFILDTGIKYQAEWKNDSNSIRVVSRLKYDESGTLVSAPLEEGDFQRTRGSLFRLLADRTITVFPNSELYSDLWKVTENDGYGGYYCELPPTVNRQYR